MPALRDRQFDLIVSGLRRHGEDTAALRTTPATLDAAHGVHRERLPEFIAGTQPQPGDGPAHTPRAASGTPLLIGSEQRDRARSGNDVGRLR